MLRSAAGAMRRQRQKTETDLMVEIVDFKQRKEAREREQRKLDPKRQDLVRRIVANHPETKWGAKELQKLHDELEAWGE
jgi:hypothetical protein